MPTNRSDAATPSRLDSKEAQAMDIFVTGATGVLGRAVVPRLVAAGHRVRGLARSAANDALLRALGAEPPLLDRLAE